MHLQKIDVIGYLFVPYLVDSYVLGGPAWTSCFTPLHKIKQSCGLSQHHQRDAWQYFINACNGDD
jgi:hypothetical protein